MYAIQIEKTGKYINWYNNNWYSSHKEPTYMFTYEEAVETTKLLCRHYIYVTHIVGEDGTDERISYLKEGNVIFSKNGMPTVITVPEQIAVTCEMDEFMF